MTDYIKKLWEKYNLEHWDIDCGLMLGSVQGEGFKQAITQAIKDTKQACRVAVDVANHKHGTVGWLHQSDAIDNAYPEVKSESNLQLR